MSGMNRLLTLAKIVLINGRNSLPNEFERYYYPAVDMYLFYSDCYFDPDTGKHHSRLILHDRMMSDLGLPFIPDDKINYISVDVKAEDKYHTYLSVNRRYYQPTEKQIDFLMDMFGVDFCKKRPST